MAEREAAEGALEIREAAPGGIGCRVVGLDDAPHVNARAAIPSEGAQHGGHHCVGAVVVLVLGIATEGAVQVVSAIADAREGHGGDRRLLDARDAQVPALRAAQLRGEPLEEFGRTNAEVAPLRGFGEELVEDRDLGWSRLA